MRAISAPLVAVAFVLSGCAEPGVRVTEQQAQTFKVGVSTYDEVVATLGAPTTTLAASNGGRVAIYTYSAALAQSHNFIPYVTHWVTGYDSHASAVSFTFDERGVLTATSSTQTDAGAGANLAAGPNGSATPYQTPR